MTFATIEDLRKASGKEVGTSAWVRIDQAVIDRFADATGDHQWIHVNPERAARGPFGTTIAHGYLTMSLLPQLTRDLLGLENARMGINYGSNRVRFPAPVPVGSNVRANVQILAVVDVEGGVQVTSRVTIECQGSDKPVCVAETVARYYA